MLNRYFRHSTISSFARQLVSYGTSLGVSWFDAGADACGCRVLEDRVTGEGEGDGE